MGSIFALLNAIIAKFIRLRRMAHSWIISWLQYTTLSSLLKISTHYTVNNFCNNTSHLYLRWDLFRLKDRMIHRMFIGSGIALFQQLSGQNSILFYAPTLLKTFGFTSNFSATLATISIGTTKFISCIITFFTIDKVGRRPLLIFGTLLLALTMLLLGSLSVIFLDPYLVLATNNSTSGAFSTCYDTSSVSKQLKQSTLFLKMLHGHLLSRPQSL